MNRNVVSVVVAFALLVGGAMISTDAAAVAGHHCGGGLFAKLKAARGCACAAPVVEEGCGGCGGGLFAKLRARRAAASCCAPEPTCCAPEPTCCAPEPACCEAAPVAEACCGEVVAAPCCGEVVMEAAPCCGADVVHGETIISEEPVAHDEHVDSLSDDAVDAPPAPEAAE